MARKTQRQKQSKKILKSKARKKRISGIVFSLFLPLALFIALIGGYTGYHLYKSGWVDEKYQEITDSLYQKTADAGFALKRIEIIGRKKTPREQILNAIGVDLGESVLKLSVNDALSKLTSIASIRSAEVERILPNTIRIRINERVPYAIWQNKGVLKVIDVDGVVLSDEPYKGNEHLLLMVGDDAPKYAKELFEMLSHEKELAQEVIAAVRVGKRRWNLKMRTGVNVMLPEKMASAAWDRLAEMQREQNILYKSIKAIDMRLYERIFIRLNEDNNNNGKNRTKSRKPDEARI